MPKSTKTRIRLASLLRRRWALLGGIGGARLLGAIGLALGTRLVTEFIDPGLFGEYKLAIGVIGLINGILLMPLVRFSMRGVHDADQMGDRSTFIGTARHSIGAVSIGICSLILLVGGVAALAGVQASVVVLILAGGLHLYLQGQFNLESALTTSLGRPGLAAGFSAAVSVLVPGALIVAALQTPSVWKLVLAHGAVFGALVVLLRRQGHGSGSGSVASWLRDARAFALPLVPVAILAWAFSVGDRYLLAWMVDTETVGRYSAVYGLVAAPLAIVGGLIPSISYEPLFRSAALKENRRNRSLLRRIVAGQTGVVGGAVLVVVLLSPLAIDTLLAEPYREGALLLVPWIAIGQGALVATFSLDLAAYSQKRTSAMAISYGIAVLVNSVANLILIPSNGALGAAMATAAAGLAYYLTMWWLVYPRGREDDHPRRIST